MKKTTKEEFPYSNFPVKLTHKDGKELKEMKTCYFQNMQHAEKYIERCKFKKKDYTLAVKES